MPLASASSIKRLLRVQFQVVGVVEVLEHVGAGLILDEAAGQTAGAGYHLRRYWLPDLNDTGSNRCGRCFRQERTSMKRHIDDANVL